MRDSLQQPVNRDAWWTRDHVLVIVLFVATGILLVLCWQLVRPFINPLAWALALAVVAHPLHGWLAHRIKKPGLAAGIAVFAIAVVLAALVIFVGQSLVISIASGSQTFQSFFQTGQWREQLARIPWLGSLLASLEQQVNLGGQLQSMAGEVGKRVSEFAAGSAWIFVQVVLTFFVLFYLFRDRRKALGTLRSLVPLSEKETDKVFARVADTIHATIFGTLAVAAVQGALGGLIFWWLGLPAPILWGAVMGLLAIVPVLGAFVVWLPAAVFLAASGQWGKAVILTLWGTVVVGLIDNLLYPIARRKTTASAYRSRVLRYCRRPGRLRRGRPNRWPGDSCAHRCHPGDLASPNCGGSSSRRGFLKTCGSSAHALVCSDRVLTVEGSIRRRGRRRENKRSDGQVCFRFGSCPVNSSKSYCFVHAPPLADRLHAMAINRNASSRSQNQQGHRPGQEQEDLFLYVTSKPAHRQVEAEQHQVDDQAQRQRQIVQCEQPTHGVVSGAEHAVFRVQGEVQGDDCKQPADDHIGLLKGLDLKLAFLRSGSARWPKGGWTVKPAAG